ncbi:kelch-like protein 12 [Branchiostoma floridae x Branchiostoma japonicum]
MADLPCGSTILSSNFGRQILHNLALQQQTGKHCDIIVVAEGRKYPAHRCVLAAASNYFCSLLEFNQPEGRPRLEGAVAQLSEVSSGGLETALEFIYTSVVNTERCSWEELLQAASKVSSAGLETALEFIYTSVVNTERCSWEELLQAASEVSTAGLDTALQMGGATSCKLSEVRLAGLETALEFIYTSVVNTERCSWEELLQAAR